MMANNHVHRFVLKSVNSTNDQPNDNGFNAMATAIYCDEKNDQDGKFATIPFSPPHINNIMVKMWARLSCKVGRVIFRGRCIKCLS